MISETDIAEKLKKIDQHKFGRLIDNLLYAGAFPQISAKHSFIEPFGNNIEKERTIKSAPRADSEIRSEGVVIEHSVEAGWADKFKREVTKYESKNPKKFIFATNQDTGTKQIRNGRSNIDAVEYAKKKTGAAECQIIGQKELISPLQNPEFFYLRRTFLGISDDFFSTPAQYLEALRSNGSYTTTTTPETFKQYAKELAASINFTQNAVYVLHNSEYGELLHAVGIWTNDEMTQNPEVIKRDYSFGPWPQKNFPNIRGVESEISKEVETIIFIWGAQDIDNLSEYLMFQKKNTVLVFVCKSGFENDVIERLKKSGGNTDIQKISIASLDAREISDDDVKIHGEKITSFVQDTAQTMQQLEALIYLYSPLSANDESIQLKMSEILGIDKAKLLSLRKLLIDSDLAAITGDILWLKQPSIAKTLLDKYIEDGTFDQEKLI